MEVFTRPAREDWMESKNEIIRRFMNCKIQFGGKMLLTGSVARKEDDEESDIDLAIITKPWLDYGDLSRIIEDMRNKARSGDRLHLSFFPSGMEKRLIERGAILVCRQN